MQRIVIIGAGAAGMFCAAELRRRLPEAQIDILEAGRHSLAKVAITGGGRCNLTNSFEDINSLQDAYPRGTQIMKRALKTFSVDDTLKWFRERGVRLTLQSDHCWFPASQNAMEIVETLRQAAHGARVHLETRVESIAASEKGYEIAASGQKYEADIVVVTTGGMNKGSKLFEDLSISLEPPVPSLFTFRINDPIKNLMGLVVENTSASIPGTKFKAQGPLLITDWGMSGPAILKLSSYAARHLAEQQYRSPLLVNWLGLNDSQAKELLNTLSCTNARKLVASVHPQEIPSRLWHYLLEKADLAERRWMDLGKSGMNKLCNTLTNDEYAIEGRAAFKAEFVTCGGIALSEVNLGTLESKKHPGLYFAGEVLDIDAITGGFNLQAAWSTGWTVAKSISEKLWKLEN